MPFACSIAISTNYSRRVNFYLSVAQTNRTLYSLLRREKASAPAKTTSIDILG